MNDSPESTVEFLFDEHAVEMRATTDFDEFIAASLAEDQVEYHQNTLDCEGCDEKTDSHSSGMNSSASSLDLDDPATQNQPSDDSNSLADPLADFLDIDIDEVTPSDDNEDRINNYEHGGDIDTYLPPHNILGNANIPVEESTLELIQPDETEILHNFVDQPTTSKFVDETGIRNLKYGNCGFYDCPKCHINQAAHKFKCRDQTVVNMENCHCDSHLMIRGSMGEDLTKRLLNNSTLKMRETNLTHSSLIISKETSWIKTVNLQDIIQCEQMGKSTCGLIAARNVLDALSYPVEIETLSKMVNVKNRNLTAPLCEYLFSRSVAGTTHEDIINAISKYTNGKIASRFFATFPKRNVKIVHFLKKWIEKELIESTGKCEIHYEGGTFFHTGAVAIVTENLQLNVEQTGNESCFKYHVPDSWHHQCVVGITHEKAILVNPLQVVSEEYLQCVLNGAPSILLVRAKEIKDRCDNLYDNWAMPLILRALKNIKWHTINVLEQVTSIVSDYLLHEDKFIDNPETATHLAIPAAYFAGISIFCDAESELWTELSCIQQELPIFE